LLGCTLVSGCAMFQGRSENVPVPATFRGVVFAADGAGGAETTSQALREAIYEERLPLQVETVRWSYGPGLFLFDQLGYSHTDAEARRLVERITAFRAQFPDIPVSMVAHSAGGAVVLAAADQLPPGSVEHIILLAPAVSHDYDLRPALRASREGVDLFCSRRDWIYLGIGTTLVGNADGSWAPPAGRVGFHVAPEAPGDAALYARLHEHPWDPTVEWTGNHGGHYGAYRVQYLRAYVIPLLKCPVAPRR
jgi:pimeloyl-ACP methyl ester carboxylesterase